MIYCTTARKAMSEKWMDFWASEFFELVLLKDGNELPYAWIAYPHRLDVSTPDGSTVTFAFADAQTLLFEAHNISVRFSPLKPYKTHYIAKSGELCLIDAGTQYIHQFASGEHTILNTPTVGAIEFHSTNAAITQGAFRYLRFEEFWQQRPTGIEGAAKGYAEQLEQWLQRMPPVLDQYHATAEKALLLLWNCQVPGGGTLTRRTIFSSKAWMNSIWSWDNCFHALAVAPVDPELAWDQLLLLFDHQSPGGILPDVLNDGAVIYGYTKPPIYGWTIRKLVEQLGHEASLPYLAALYEPLSRLTNWWYTMRGGENGMCSYHDGNDSGWDNTTIFDAGDPVEGLDLATYLTLQMETLAFMAEVLGKPEAAQSWQKRAAEQLKILLKHITDSNYFSAPRSENKKREHHSLQPYMLIMLGKRLPQSIIESLKADLAEGGPFLTTYGLASESPHSPKYEDDSYWRGPIWAPPNYQIVEGLTEIGEIALARLIAQRYCDMLVKEPGFYENYSASTGKGLRSPAVCWTAAVFLLLASWLEQHPTNE